MSTLKGDGKIILINFLVEAIQKIRVIWITHIEDRNCRFVWRIRMTEVNEALRRVKMGSHGI